MVDKTLYISGQLGLGKDGQIVRGGTLSQAEQSLRNIGEILEAAGGSYRDVIKTTVLMKDISEFSAVNNIYSNFFQHHQPARAAFQVSELNCLENISYKISMSQVAALPKGGNIEIEAVAIIGAVDVGSVLLNKTSLANL